MNSSDVIVCDVDHVVNVETMRVWYADVRRSTQAGSDGLQWGDVRKVRLFNPQYVWRQEIQKTTLTIRVRHLCSRSRVAFERVSPRQNP
jgi:hypothetical protein